MAAAAIFSPMRAAPFLFALWALVMPMMAAAQTVLTQPTSADAARQAAAQAVAAAVAPSPNTGTLSRWVLLPKLALNDALYPAPDASGAAPTASVVGTSSHQLRNGYSVVMTLIRLDNRGTAIAATRPYDMLRCYEYFKPDFSQESTRCFVLQRRA